MSKRHRSNRGTVNQQNAGITDDSAVDVVKEVGDHRDIEEINFAQNSLSSKGLEAVVDLCLRCEKLRVVKLFKNKLDDFAVEGLSQICQRCPKIEEMHLSHNQMTSKGIRELVTAAEASRSDSQNPLWLRIEQNQVSDPHVVFQDLCKRKLSLCDRKDESRCNVRKCFYGKKVHLPFFNNQGKGGGRGQGWRRDHQGYDRNDYHRDDYQRDDYQRDREDYREDQGRDREGDREVERERNAVVLTARADLQPEEREPEEPEPVRESRKHREDPQHIRNGERPKRHRRREVSVEDRRMPAPDRHQPLAIEDRPAASGRRHVEHGVLAIEDKRREDHPRREEHPRREDHPRREEHHRRGRRSSRTAVEEGVRDERRMAIEDRVMTAPVRRHRPYSSRDDPRCDPRWERRRELPLEQPPGDWGPRAERAERRERHGHRRRDPRGDVRGEPLPEHPRKRRRHHIVYDPYDPREPPPIRESRRERRRRHGSPGRMMEVVQERPMKRRRRCEEDYRGEPARQPVARHEERRVVYGRRGYDDRREECPRSHRAGAGKGVSAAGGPAVGISSHPSSHAPPVVPAVAQPQDADDSCSSSYSESSVADGAGGPPPATNAAYTSGSMSAQGSFAASSTAVPTVAPRINSGGGAVSKIAQPGSVLVSCSESDDESSSEAPVDLAVPNVPVGLAPATAPLSDNPRPRSVDRSPGSSESSEHHRWAEDRGCSPPLASRSRSGSLGATRPGGPGDHDPMARMSILKKRLSEKCQRGRRN